ncbi:MAG: PAS domain S-box protein, partial [Gemmataceae bacterium]|nr:PAS domain S-box protein [Gemmataceae bacterium]
MATPQETRPEGALRESEERFRRLFEESGIGMAIVAPDGRWLRVNEAMARMLGYTEAELLAIDFQAVTHPDDLGPDLALVRSTLAGERRGYQMEKRYWHRDGRLVWVILTVSLVRGEAGEPLYFISQVQDISERKRLEQELRRSEEHFRLLAENASDIVTLVGMDGRVAYSSPSVAQMGWTPADLAGSAALDLVHPDDREKAAAAIAECAAARGAVVESDLRLRCKDGSYRWLHHKGRAV